MESDIIWKQYCANAFYCYPWLTECNLPYVLFRAQNPATRAVASHFGDYDSPASNNIISERKAPQIDGAFLHPKVKGGLHGEPIQIKQ